MSSKKKIAFAVGVIALAAFWAWHSGAITF